MPLKTLGSYDLFLSQANYINKLLAKTSMFQSKGINTPLAQKHDIHSNSWPLIDTAVYISIVGGLIKYITFTQPDLSYAVNLVYQYMQQLALKH